MKFTQFTAFLFALGATAATIPVETEDNLNVLQERKPCATNGDLCDVLGNRRCGCGTGRLLECQVGLWGVKSFARVKDCPNNPHGLQCVNGKCLVKV